MRSSTSNARCSSRNLGSLAYGPTVGLFGAGAIEGAAFFAGAGFGAGMTSRAGAGAAFLAGADPAFLAGAGAAFLAGTTFLAGAGAAFLAGPTLDRKSDGQAKGLA